MPGAVAVAVPFWTCTPFRSANQLTCVVTSLTSPLTLPVAMNCAGDPLSAPELFAVNVMDAIFGLTSNDSRPLMGAGPTEPATPPRPVPALPVVADGFTPAQPPPVATATPVATTRIPKTKARKRISWFMSGLQRVGEGTAF